jgi:squalene-hopene/tetraprenyl-beta-curcumene cyclase
MSATGDADPVTRDRLDSAWQQAVAALLAELRPDGHWVGELSPSALSTSTALMALLQLRQQGVAIDSRVLAGGVDWLIAEQCPDGGWGDTSLSHSNISTTMLVRATLTEIRRTAGGESIGEVPAAALERAEAAIHQFGGVPALLARYGRDRTFSIPILTHCALAGLVEWREIPRLPFELACLPQRFYKSVRLPVVSYALPALIAIGQVRHGMGPPWNPLTRWIRNAARAPSLRVLEQIQPASGGYLEATPLTSFVTMSLAALGQARHPVAERGLQFLLESVRPDGSWPIDTNLATWVTTLAINALGPELPSDLRPPLQQWLLNQQWRQTHPYTNSPPGGWAWTDLSGGVPDADDTPGAILALLTLAATSEPPVAVRDAIAAAVGWLLGLQNRDGGWPTFCRGWGLLPFDRSSCDLTAHAVRALHAARGWLDSKLVERVGTATDRAIQFLRGQQRSDGAWLPLWFGNQDVPGDENPTYGTARVLLACRDLISDRPELEDLMVRGAAWLAGCQNSDGGFGGGGGTRSTLEETGLALEALCSLPVAARISPRVIHAGIAWLTEAVERGAWREPSPIGFYFAKLWYFERLYPLVFSLAALRQARAWLRGAV